VRCPFCELEAARPELHAHLTDVHADRVVVEEGMTGRRYFRLDCPLCDDHHKQEIKPRLRDPAFIEEYAREIRVVAFDRFLYHLQFEHEEETSG